MQYKFISRYKVLVSTKRQRITAVMILFLILYLILFNNMLTANFLLPWNIFEDISCYYSEVDDNLPSADGMDFSPSPKSIFFHETSCIGNLTSRQSCAIESAARAHPDFQIHVLFNAPISKAVLQDIRDKHTFSNVRFARIHINKYAEGSALENLIDSGELNRTQWRVSHTSDVLRFLTLSKWGGIYLDMDVVVAKRLDSLGGNWAAKESDITVAAGALAFSRDRIGRTIATASAREIAENFRGDLWGHNGPGVITRVLERFCETPNITLMTSASCNGFEVYGPELFYPIKWQDSAQYCKPGDLENKDAYVYHVWNQLTKNLKVHEDSPYAQLARQFCPSTYTLYGDLFGT